jgi:hypothetical protein
MLIQNRERYYKILSLKQFEINYSIVKVAFLIVSGTFELF